MKKESKAQRQAYNDLNMLCRSYVKQNFPHVYDQLRRAVGIADKRTSPRLQKILDSLKDGCEICGGAKGGVPGNENIIDGKRVCDYCHAEMLEKQKP